MDPTGAAVTESEAGVMDPDGVGCGLEFEDPPPWEPEERVEDPQPGRIEDAVRASAPWMACRRVQEDDCLRVVGMRIILVDSLSGLGKGFCIRF